MSCGTISKGLICVFGNLGEKRERERGEEKLLEEIMTDVFKIQR